MHPPGSRPHRMPLDPLLGGAVCGVAFIISCTYPLGSGGRIACTQPAASEVVESLDDAMRTTYAGGLVGSKHDFSRDGETPRDLCLSCHTPHLTAGAAPLLDHAPTRSRTVSLDQGADRLLDHTSLLCLSCHDGVTAIDVYTSTHASRFASQVGISQLGAGPSSSHPIGGRYPLSDEHYHMTARATADGAVKLPSERVQCISCHDPHNTMRHPYMLVKSNQRSALCLTCHRL